MDWLTVEKESKYIIYEEEEEEEEELKEKKKKQGSIQGVHSFIVNVFFLELSQSL